MHKVVICRGYFFIDKLLTQNNRQHVIINSKEHWSLSTVLTDTEHPMHTHTHKQSDTHTYIACFTDIHILFTFLIYFILNKSLPCFKRKPNSTTLGAD